MYDIVPIDEYESDPFDLDMVDALFEQMGIRASRYEQVVYAAQHADGTFIGAITHGLKPYGDYQSHTFSVVVAPGYRRQGIARALVSSVIEDVNEWAIQTGQNPEYQVWVVNPHMAALLESMGFEPEGLEWTEDAPHMYRSYNNPRGR